MGSFVEGLSSGATGFTKNAGGGLTSFDLEQVSGTFIAGEQVRINCDDSLTRSIKDVVKNGLEDVMSVHQEDTFISGADFSGDLVLEPKVIKELGLGDEVAVSTASGGASTLTCAGKTFGSLKVGDHIMVNVPGDTNGIRINRINSISGDLKTLTLAATNTVTNVSTGTLLSNLTPTGIHIARPKIFLSDAGLYAELQKKNVSDVSLAQSKLFIKSQVEKTASSGTLTVSVSDLTDISDASFVPFDADRYSISKKIGGASPDTRHQTLEASQVVLGANNQ